jgi:hypothetical protein
VRDDLLSDDPQLLGDDLFSIAEIDKDDVGPGFGLGEAALN